nr:glycosyltransferase family 2 protein [uncultured Intestinibacter sp.]
MCKVSVIVPIYNSEKYLERCIKSIINQSLRDIEIILINDGSKDNSLNICKNFHNKDSRIKIIDKENEGVGSARNDGIKIAKGEWISFIDSDDFVESDFLECLYNEAISKNVEICGCLYDEYKDEKFINVPNFKNLNINGLSTGKEFLNFFYNPSNSYESVCCVVVWNKIYKTAFIKEILFTNVKSAEDDEFSFKAVQKSKIIYVVDKVLYHYFTDNQDSLIKKPFGVHKLDFLKVLEGRKDLIKDNKYIYYKNLYLLCNISIEYYFKIQECDKRYNKVIKEIFNKNFKEVLRTNTIKIKDKIRFLKFYINVDLYRILAKNI